MSYNFQTAVKQDEALNVNAPALQVTLPVFQKPATPIQANNDNPAQKSETTCTSLFLGAVLGGVSEVADATLDAAETIGERRADNFQTLAIEAANNNSIALGKPNVINGDFGSSAQGVESMDLERIKPQMRYLNQPSFAYGMKRFG